MVVHSLLFGASMALRYGKRPRLVRAFVVGLALALMHAAHPTLALLGLALVACSLVAALRDWRVVLHFAAMGLPLLASLAPVLIQQWLGGREAPERLSSYARSDWSLLSPVAGLELIHVVVLRSPHHLARYWLGLSRDAAAVLFAACLALLRLAAMGLALRPVTIAAAADRGKGTGIRAVWPVAARQRDRGGPSRLPLPFKHVSLALLGQALAPAYADLTLSLFVIPGDGNSGARSWRLQLYASPEHVDVLALEASARR
jgi:hypothetical protein